MASDIEVEELIRKHIQARRAAVTLPIGFHRRVMARLDGTAPRRLGVVPQLAIAFAIVLSVALVAVGLTYIRSQQSPGPALQTPAQQTKETPYTIPSPPPVASSCSSAPRQWASSPPRPAKMLSPTTGWAYGPMRTTDGGAHWLDVSPPSIPGRTPKNDELFLDATHAWVAETASSPKACVDHVVIFRTTDAGRTWQQAQPLPVRYEVSTDVIWTGPDNHSDLFSFVDAQHGWLLLGSGATTATAADGGSQMWIGATWRVGDLYRTTDGGLHWSLVATNPGSAAGCVPGTRAGPGVGPVMSFSSTRTGWIIGDCGLLVTHDGGVTWSRSATSSAPREAPLFFDARHGLIVAEGGLLMTSDGGNTWGSRSLPASMYAVDFINSSEAWGVSVEDNAIQCSVQDLVACDGNFRLYYTRDSGKTWVPGSSTSLMLPAPKYWPPSYLHFVDSRNGFLDPGGDPADTTHELSGLFKTTDGGHTWTRVAGTVQGP